MSNTLIWSNPRWVVFSRVKGVLSSFLSLVGVWLHSLMAREGPRWKVEAAGR